MIKFRIKLLFLIFLAENLSNNLISALTLTCEDFPCKHRSKCENVKNGLFNDDGIERNYRCICRYGYTGYDCESNLPVTDLLANLCLNNGTINSDMVCTCQPGYFGPRCEIKRSKNTYLRTQHGCLNNGVQPKDGLPCKCPPGYFGMRCEYVRGDQNNLISTMCRNSPCMNGGICTAINSGFICSCPTGYHGKYCQYSIYSRTYGGFGSLMPFLLFFSLTTMCLYCCCFKKKIPLMEQRILNGTFLETGRAQNSNPNQAQTTNMATPSNHVIYIAQNNTSEIATQKPNNDLPPSYDEIIQKTTAPS